MSITGILIAAAIVGGTGLLLGLFLGAADKKFKVEVDEKEMAVREELRSDIEEAVKFIPGNLKMNIHANYQEADHFVDRNEIAPEHFDK